MKVSHKHSLPPPLPQSPPPLSHSPSLTHSPSPSPPSLSPPLSAAEPTPEEAAVHSKVATVLSKAPEVLSDLHGYRGAGEHIREVYLTLFPPLLNFNPRTETSFCILLKFYAIVKLINIILP